MLTPERLSEVEWALSKIADATAAVEKLLDGEEVSQPPSARSKAMREMLSYLDSCESILRRCFS